MENPNDAQVAAAKAYEALFVPALFGQWASRVADAANLVSGERVLDVACGTGVLAREAHLRTGPTGYVAGIDPGVGMLAVAEELTPSVDWQQGTAEALPFPDATFDVVVSQFGLMFMERDHAIREMLRVLKTDGRLVVAVWDSVESMPAFAAEIALLERLAGTRAADALRAPFALGDRELLAKAFNDADPGAFTISTSTGVARFPSIQVMVEADLRGWLPVMGVNLSEEQIARVLSEADATLGAYVADDGRVVFDVRAHLVTGRRMRRPPWRRRRGVSFCASASARMRPHRCSKQTAFLDGDACGGQRQFPRRAGARRLRWRRRRHSSVHLPGGRAAVRRPRSGIRSRSLRRADSGIDSRFTSVWC